MRTARVNAQETPLAEVLAADWLPISDALRRDLQGSAQQIVLRRSLAGIDQLLVLRDANDVNQMHVIQRRAVREAHGLDLTLSAQCAEKMRAFTGKHPPDASGRGRKLAIIDDGIVIEAPTMRERVGERLQILAPSMWQAAQELAIVLNSGTLPIPVKPMRRRD